MNPEIAELLNRPTISVDELATVLDICRNAAYQAVSRGDVEVIRIGSRIRVPTMPLRRKLGIVS